MRALLPLSCVVLVGCSPAALAEAERGGTGPIALRIVTWNVHDLFDEIDRTASPGEEDDVPSPAEVEGKLARVGRVLHELDADVLVLQEVENAALLERLAAGQLPGGGYRAVLREGHDPRGIDVGVLARVPFSVGPTHLEDRAPDGRLLWSRDVLEIHVDLGTRPVVLLGAHLVSRVDAGEDERRRLQAARLRQLADEVHAGSTATAVLIVGDLNDVPGSESLAPLLEDGAFVDLAARQGREGVWTWSGGGAQERLDYALVDAAHRSLVTRVAVQVGADVTAASDHRPVVVDLWGGSVPGAVNGRRPGPFGALETANGRSR